MATKADKTAERPADRDLTELNREASAAARAACLPDAVNPPGTGAGMKHVTTSDTA